MFKKPVFPLQYVLASARIVPNRIGMFMYLEKLTYQNLLKINMQNYLIMYQLN